MFLLFQKELDESNQELETMKSTWEMIKKANVLNTVLRNNLKGIVTS